MKTANEPFYVHLTSVTNCYHCCQSYYCHQLFPLLSMSLLQPAVTTVNPTSATNWYHCCQSHFCHQLLLLFSIPLLSQTVTKSQFCHRLLPRLSIPLLPSTVTKCHFCHQLLPVLSISLLPPTVTTAVNPTVKEFQGEELNKQCLLPFPSLNLFKNILYYVCK